MSKNSSDLTVYKDNYLVEASYKLSLMEQRIMLFAISRLDPRKPQDKHSFYVTELLEFYPDIDPNSAYRALREAVNKLSERWVRTEDPEKIREFRWVESRAYFKDEGRIDIVFTKSIMPYLSQLESQFTKYQLENVASFRGTYSIRIYELLTQYKTRGGREIQVDELKDVLQVADKYPRYNSFREWVILPAIEEINEKSDLLVSFTPVKRGRTVVALNFKVQPKPKEKQLDLVDALGEQGKTRKIHGVFVEMNRPQVAKGSQAEADWAKNNYSRAIKQLRELGILKVRFIEHQLKDIPTEWLKVIKRYASITDRYLSRDIADELDRRK